MDKLSSTPRSELDGGSFDRARGSDRAAAADPVVKSASRTLEILEYFDDVQREASVTQVAEALQYPQSSTSVLLLTLTRCGYLSYDPQRRSYYPSPRVALLGHWLPGGIIANGPLIEVMQDLSRHTGETIILATRSGTSSKYIKVVQARSPRRAHIALGSVRPLSQSCSGLAMLSILPDEDVTRIVTRIRAEARHPERMRSVREVLEIVREGRTNGYFFAVDLVVPGASMLAVALPKSLGDLPMSLAVGGQTGPMLARKREILELLSESSLHRLGQNLVEAGDGNTTG
jgi:DNA-binding IclR family transcriptional regulator